jgi:polysaccharide pyruvyl transferase WcaK-like protein
LTEDNGKSLDRRRASVVLSNVFADDNRGGAAITVESISAARAVFPDCSIGLVAVAAGADAETHRHTLAAYPEAELLQPLVHVPHGKLGPLRAFARSLALLTGGGRRNRSHALERIRQADLVMSKGGQVFKDRRTIGGIASVWLSNLPLLMGWRLGKPTVIYSATIGPIENKRARPVVGWIIRRADWVFVRDARSRTEAISLGVSPGRIYEMPDCVFGRKPPNADQCGAIAERFGLAPGRFAAVTLQSSIRARPDEHVRFLKELSLVTKGLLEREVIDRVAVVAQVDGEISSDMKQNKKFLDLCADERVVLVSADLSPEEMTAFYGAARLTLGCRVHSVIFSLVAGTPSWVATMGGLKAHDLLVTLGLVEFVFTYPEFDPEQLTNEILAHMRRADDLRRRIAAAVSDANMRVRDARGRLRAAVRSNGAGPSRLQLSRSDEDSVLSARAEG